MKSRGALPLGAPNSMTEYGGPAGVATPAVSLLSQQGGPLARRVVAAATVVAAVFGAAQEAAVADFATSDSRANYVHRIDLYDAQNRKIDAESDQPYSPTKTCGRCHDVSQIHGGFHFSVNNELQAAGRPGEPWMWMEPSIGTQLPLSYRRWRGAYEPAQVGVSDYEFLARFGQRTCGGYPGLPEAKAADSDESESAEEGGADKDPFRLSGRLEVDCMICHGRGSSFDLEEWSNQTEDENFAWASTAALGLGTVDGVVSRLPEDFDPEAAEAANSRRKLPTVAYDQRLFDAEGQVFFNIVRTPENNACYRCHTNQVVGPEAPPRWTHDQDVHLRAGFQCVDCHPNGLSHATVRGFEGEEHPQQESVATLSCRGCHIGPDEDSDEVAFSGGGRLGAPFPEHRGLPPIHFEKMSCTACHSGPIPGAAGQLVQTSRNHLLGHKSHRHPEDLPQIAASVLMPNEAGVLAPHRVVWPTFWAIRSDDGLQPVDVPVATEALRRTLRVRRDFLEEMTSVRLTRSQKAELLGEERAKLPDDELNDDERQKIDKLAQSEGVKAFHEKIQAGLAKLSESLDGADVVYVAGDNLYELNDESQLEIVENPGPEPYAWPLAHDVRPARWSLGANGCTDCHSTESAFLIGNVTTGAPVPSGDLSPPRTRMAMSGIDADQWDAWATSFRFRSWFKAALIGTVGIAVLTLLVAGIALLGRRRGPTQHVVDSKVTPEDVT